MARRCGWHGRGGPKARPRAGAVLLAASLLVFTGAAASAETLRQALSRAYMNNPDIAAERARLRATDEGVAKAKSGWRPQVSVSGTATLGHTHTSPASPALGRGWDYNQQSVTITLNQPVFNGFKTVESVRQAKAGVQAGRQNLLAVEQQVLLDATMAYMDVVRDREIVRLRRRNIQVLKEQLAATQARFKVGEVTKTDVQQARAALAKARSDYAQAKAQLAASRANYERVVGHMPGRLRFPKRLPRLPRTLQAALARAERLNPGILAAAYNARAAEHAIKVALADLYPQLSLSASFTASRSKNEGQQATRSRDARIMGTLTIPIYQGGMVHASVREARHKAEAARLGEMSARQEVRKQVISAWNNLIAARQVIAAASAQVRAAKLAYEGVKEEYKVGSRTTLDVLNARQTLLDARVALISARTAEVQAAYGLLAAIGELTATRLGLAVAAYDPAAHYQAVKDKWFGLKR
jgi:TolC family type I secretion outer membrane protein